MTLPGGAAPHGPGHRVLELVRFGTVGASSTILYLGLYALAVLVGLPFLVAATAAFVPVVVYGYLVHDRWTFRTRAPTGGGLARWLVLQGSVLVLNNVALWALVQHLGIDRLIAQVLLLPLLPPTTYLLSRRRVFRAS